MTGVNVDGYPTTCASCGKPVRAKDNAGRHFNHRLGEAVSWHLACPTPKQVGP